MEGFEIGVAVVTVLAFVLLFISMVAFRRDGSRGILILSIVFAVFLAKGVVLSSMIFSGGMDNESDTLTFSIFMDMVILLFLFFFGLSAPKKAEGLKKGSKDSSKEGT